MSRTAMLALGVLCTMAALLQPPASVDAGSSVIINVAGASPSPVPTSVVAPITVHITGINAIRFKSTKVVDNVSVVQTVLTQSALPTPAAAPVATAGHAAAKPAGPSPTPSPIPTRYKQLLAFFDAYASLATKADNQLTNTAYVPSIVAAARALPSPPSSAFTDLAKSDGSKKLSEAIDGAVSSHELTASEKTTLTADYKMASGLTADSVTLGTLAPQLVDAAAYLGALDAINFSQSHGVNCGFNEAHHQLVLDEAPLFGSTNTSVAVTTANCPSGIVPSAGAGISFVHNITFAFISSSPTIPPTPQPTASPAAFINRFGYSENSTSQVMIPVFLNARLFESPSGGIYLTGGAVGGGTGGYGFGVTYSLGGTAFLTVGDHFSQVQMLAGGYKPGDIVPPNLSAPPTTKQLQQGLFFSLTYPIQISNLFAASK